MKKNVLAAIAVIALAAAAHAGQPGNNGGGRGGCGHGQQTNGCGGGGAPAPSTTTNNTNNPTAVGTARSSSTSASLSSAAAGAAAEGGRASALGGAASAEGGAGGAASATGNGAGNTTKVAVDASTRVERSAPSVGVGQQTQPVVDCRRTIGGGGSNASGSMVVSGIPLWKESDCEGVMGVRSMIESGVFTPEDVRQVACTIERVSITKTCKEQRERERRADEAKRPQVAAGPSSSQMP